jgi:hypothetical protein
MNVGERNLRELFGPVPSHSTVNVVGGVSRPSYATTRSSTCPLAAPPGTLAMTTAPNGAQIPGADDDVRAGRLGRMVWSRAPSSRAASAATAAGGAVMSGSGGSLASLLTELRRRKDVDAGKHPPRAQPIQGMDQPEIPGAAGVPLRGGGPSPRDAIEASSRSYRDA